MYVPFLSTADQPAPAPWEETPPTALEAPKDSLAVAPLLVVTPMCSKFGAGLGARIFSTSLNLSTAVPIVVPAVKLENKPSA